ncbi:hypothetical protein BDV95DRAFT_611811 [Massariosphaeria phaeospora]|uniref:Uncharacterized protein n=1 Tax=Massariosphaeria phaeospora TaxID=100035 RepID=A0A7C8I3W7_9PLEO|nr:hypothetical protein BDV95DRAFT_611811 [Massariosphaeria phaeospora]
MSGNSNVGQASVYEANDQKKQEPESAERFKEGKQNSHLAQDSKDERSIANKLERESQRDADGSHDSEETRALKQDATLPAKLHGNEPSKGAKIDQELKEEEEAYLKKKDAAKK